VGLEGENLMPEKCKPWRSRRGQGLQIFLNLKKNTCNRKGKPLRIRARGVRSAVYIPPLNPEEEHKPVACLFTHIACTNRNLFVENIFD
jgi:hypothetical protein